MTSFDPARISDEAIIVAFGWFSFGSKASVTSNPPHANMKARQAALDELLAAKLITHEHEYHQRFGIDRHHFKGTAAIGALLGTDRAMSVLASAIEARSDATPKSGAAEGESAVAATSGETPDPSSSSQSLSNGDE